MKAPKTIEEAVSIIEALNARTAENDVRIGEQVAELREVPDLKNMVEALTAERSELQSQLAEMTAHATALRDDHAEMSGMLKGFTDNRKDGSVKIIRRIERMEVAARIAALQAHAETLRDD